MTVDAYTAQLYLFFLTYDACDVVHDAYVIVAYHVQSDGILACAFA